MVKVKFKKINNIVKIEDSENEELKGKKYFIEFYPFYLNFHKINFDKYYFLLEDEILNERNEVIGWIKRLE
ncbi:MAG TPA: hypothetical protein PLK48_06365 [Caldisericia bacterium]|nr:hypothetical protein [Caldisericia bacterium]